jgi:hypothetical protein
MPDIFVWKKLALKYFTESKAAFIYICFKLAGLD